MAASAFAGGTRTWRVTSYKDFDEGEATGVLLSSLGEATSGFRASRIDVSESVVYSSAAARRHRLRRHRRPGRRLRVQRRQAAQARQARRRADRVARGRSERHACSPAPCRADASSPSTATARSAKRAKLDAEHVWALVLRRGQADALRRDRSQRPALRDRRVAARSTGRRTARSPDLRHRREALACRWSRGDDGALYAGSADQAILYRSLPTRRQRRQGRRRCTTSKATSCAPSLAAATTLYVAVNEFQRSGGTTTTTLDGPNAPRGTKMVVPRRRRPRRRHAGLRAIARARGAVYRVDPDGRVEQLHALADGYFTALHVDGDGNVWAAAGSNGRVYLIRPDRTVHHRVRSARAAGAHARFDATHKKAAERPARHRRRRRALSHRDPIRRRTRTTSPRCSTRSSRRAGATCAGAATARSRSRRARATPRTPTRPGAAGGAAEAGRSAATAAPAMSPRPPGAICRCRAGFGGARTRAARSHRLLSAAEPARRASPRSPSVRRRRRSTSSAFARGGKPRSPVVKLRWKVENPDDDELVYRLSFREEGEANWKPIGGPEPLTRTEYDWNTESIPDGNYVVKRHRLRRALQPAREALEHSLDVDAVPRRQPQARARRRQGRLPVRVGPRARQLLRHLRARATRSTAATGRPFAPQGRHLDDPSRGFQRQAAAGARRRRRTRSRFAPSTPPTTSAPSSSPSASPSSCWSREWLPGPK